MNLPALCRSVTSAIYTCPPVVGTPTVLPSARQAHQAQQDGLSEGSVLLLQTYLGLGWALGCWAFGFVVVRNNQVRRASRQRPERVREIGKMDDT